MTRFDDTPEDKATTIGRPMPQTEVKIVDPLSGAIGADEHGRRALRARLHGDARLFRERGGHGPMRSMPTAGTTPATRIDGRTRLLPHRRPAQGT